MHCLDSGQEHEWLQPMFNRILFACGADATARRMSRISTR
jgi:hypothetical protein